MPGLLGRLPYVTASWLSWQHDCQQFFELTAEEYYVLFSLEGPVCVFASPR